MIISHELYILFVIATAAMLLACGLMLLFIDIPRSHLIDNYRKSRYVLAVTYLFIVVAIMAEYLFAAGSSEIDIPLLQTIILIIAVLQASLFSLALLTLLEVRYPGWRYIFGKLVPAQLMMISVAAVYIFCPQGYFRVAYYVFFALYAVLLVYYTYLFLTVYRRFRLRMDNYFSGDQEEKIRWVAVSFFTALAIGLMALLSAVLTSLLTVIIFTLVFNAFYLWFAFRFINYRHRFQVIEHALNEETETPQTEETSDGDHIETDDSDTVIFAKLEKRINQWVDNKRFTKKSITIALLSKELLTNRNFLSTYINTCKGNTFREWINQLRIAEAKKLMRQDPNITVKEIAQQTGFTNKSHFIRQFTNLTGASPKKWKQESELT